MNVKRLFFTLVAVLACATMYGQSRRDASRYDEMNSRGVWSVGVGIAPLTSLVHPAGAVYGGGVSSLGVCGVVVEGGYFVADNLRVAVEYAYGDNSVSTLFDDMSGAPYANVSSSTFGLLGYYHLGRWYAGAGVTFGTSRLHYRASLVDELSDIERFGSESFTQRRPSFGFALSGGYHVSPFMKVGGYWRPSLAKGGYAHSLGVVATIYLPFVEAVVCK